MNRTAFVGTLVFLSLAACEQRSNDVTKLDIQKGSTGQGILATLENASGDRFTLDCSGDGEPSFQLHLAKPAQTPPPLRGVYGEFRVDGGLARLIELGWATGGTWMARDDDPAEQATTLALVQEVIQARDLTLQPPAGYSQPEPIEWQVEALGQSAEVGRLCASSG